MKICNDPDCKKSGQLQPLSAFYKNNAGVDGHQSKCSECEKHRKRLKYYEDAKRFSGHNISNDSALPAHVVGLLNQATRRIHGNA